MTLFICLYPARFSPAFASTAIELFSNPGDIVLDPYMGGGTTIVEAMVAGRRAIGADLNSLFKFLIKVKPYINNIC
ncbi:MAG: site-specific DNA-methyltransferase [Methanomassiliicoccales archaeon]|nr:MAG: site-specific DNA-methyltransferase [Methanomassiliicoccales archaeon]